MKRSSGPHKTANLSESLHRRLNMYAIAAGAAGVSMLALAQPADAKIVYTAATVKLVGNPFPLDLNHDGIVDFFLFHFYASDSSEGGNSLLACHLPFSGSGGHTYLCIDSSRAPNALNAIRIVSKGAAALRAGAKIQRGDRFLDKHRVELGRVTDVGTASMTPRWYGPWVNGGKGVKNRYLGIKFKIKGRFHYGWARITVATTYKTFTATLTGYAYETIPGKGIVAGQTKGSDDIDNIIEQPNPAVLTAPTPESATLGALAMGAPGLSIWRREESLLRHE